MRKTIALLLSALTLLTAAGCSGDDHVHEYTLKRMNPEDLAAEESCFAGRLYYYACAGCGASCKAEKDPKRHYVWAGSDALGHQLTAEGCARSGCTWASLDHGVLSTGVQWAFFADGSLQFFGNGALPDWTEAQMLNREIPWSGKPVRQLVIPKTVTAIGAYSFTGLTSLTQAELPWGVTTLGESAFEGCTKLSALSLPDSLNSIGKNAFRACVSLSTVTLPRYTAFLDGNPFAECTSLSTITVAPGNQAYTVKNGCLVENSTGTLISATVSGNIPGDGSIQIIGESAFEGMITLPAIHIPASVHTIGDNAFKDCAGVSSITVDLTNQYFTAGGNCLIRRADKVLIRGCGASVIPVNGTVAEIGDYAFSGCAGMATLHLPSSVNVVSNTAFLGCTGIEKITVATGNPTYTAMGNCLITAGMRTLLLGCKTSVIPTDGSVVRIGGGAFAGTAIREIVIPDAVTEIGDSAFENCKELTAVTFGKGIQTAAQVNAKAFKGCSALKDVAVAEGHSTLAVDLGNLIDTATKTLVLATNQSVGITRIDENTTRELDITSIGDYAFAGREIEYFYVPKAVTAIGEGAFYGCAQFANIYYEGTAESWAKITCGTGWTAFTKYVGEPVITEPEA